MVGVIPNLVQMANLSRPWILMALPTSSSLVCTFPPSPTDYSEPTIYGYKTGENGGEQLVVLCC